MVRSFAECQYCGRICHILELKAVKVRGKVVLKVCFRCQQRIEAGKVLLEE